jgi:hypothetical protein
MVANRAAAAVVNVVVYAVDFGFTAAVAAVAVVASVVLVALQWLLIELLQQ